MATIIYTHTDEAPLLATYSFLPIIAGVRRQGRRRGRDPRHLPGRAGSSPSSRTAHRRAADRTTRSPSSAQLAKTPEANIIKLPNVSASIPQLKAAIKELQEQGYDLPDYPENPQTDEEQGRPAPATTRSRAPRSTRCCARATPTAARRRRSRTTPRRTRTAWAPGRADSKTNVATMGKDDFRSNEKSVVLAADDTLRIEHVAADGTVTVLKESIPVLAGEVVDGTFMNVAALRRFLTEQIARAKAEDVLFSVHLKATMMKVSDPIIFGHVVQAFFPTLFEQYGDALADRGHLAQRRPRRAARRGRRRCPRATRSRPPSSRASPTARTLAMVDSDKGITNLHVPSDVIIDASMPAMIRSSGHMWGPDGEEADTLAVIPDSSLRRRLPDRPRRLPRPRRLRPGHDGLGAQRRPDGQGGRGVRLARQDLRDPGRRHGPGRQRRRRRAHRARRRARRHLARLPDQGRADPRLGQARRHPRPRHRLARRSSGSTRPAPTTPT